MHDRGFAPHKFVGSWRLDTFEAAASGAQESFDRVVVVSLPGRLRLAVLDAAINTRVPDAVPNARRALADVTSALEVDVSLHAALDLAARRLHDPAARYRHRSGLVVCAAVDIFEGAIEAVRAGDAELWLPSQGRFVNVFAEDMLTVQGRSEFGRVCVEADAGLIGSAWEGQEAVLDDLDLWNWPTLGLSETAEPQVHRQAPAPRTIVASTDGARLNANAFGDLESHLSAVASGSHGDVAVIVARDLGQADLESHPAATWHA